MLHPHHVLNDPGAPLLLGFLGIHIKLPKIAIGRFIGQTVAKNVPGGSTIVGAVNKAIDVVKGAKLQPGVILKRAIETAASDAAADVKREINDALTQSGRDQALAGVGGNTGLLVILGAVAALFLLRRK